MAGPGIRSYWFARELAARGHDVTLVVPFETDLERDGLEVVQADPNDARRLWKLARGFDVVIAMRLPVTTMIRLARSPTRTIYDLYDPVLLELLAYNAQADPGLPQRLFAHYSTIVQEVALITGDAFVCGSEQQRDLWLGSLAALRRLDQERYSRDPALRNFIDIVPFGVPAEPPWSQGPVLKGVVPGIGESDKVLLWGGGIWNWLDPLTVIRAVAELAHRRDDIRLFFLGLKHPNPGTGEMAMIDRAVSLAEELGLLDRNVFFNSGWVPYAERASYLLESDLGVSAHFDDVETRFALRTRLVDCLWARLPMVVTRGDALSDLVTARDLGRVVDFGDVSGWVEAIDSLLNDEETYSRTRANIEAVRGEFSWDRVVAPLARLAEVPGTRSRRSLRLRLILLEYFVLRVRLTLKSRGMLGAAAHVFRRVGRRLPGVRNA
jgi:glycosyltransferase involved in cell wall biosynthesis